MNYTIVADDISQNAIITTKIADRQINHNKIDISGVHAENILQD